MDPTKYGPANHKFQILRSATLLPYRHVVSKYTVQYCTNTFITLFLTYFYLKKFLAKAKLFLLQYLPHSICTVLCTIFVKNLHCSIISLAIKLLERKQQLGKCSSVADSVKSVKVFLTVLSLLKYFRQCFPADLSSLSAPTLAPLNYFAVCRHQPVGWADF